MGEDLLQGISPGFLLWSPRGGGGWLGTWRLWVLL